MHQTFSDQIGFIGEHLFSSPFSCSPARAVWLHWPFAAPPSSAPAPPVRPAASVAAPVASVEPRGAAPAGPDAADSHTSGWLKGNIKSIRFHSKLRVLVVVCKNCICTVHKGKINKDPYNQQLSDKIIGKQKQFISSLYIRADSLINSQ